VQSTATADTRGLAAIEVDELIRQAVSLGNTQFEGRYIFGGSMESSSPFEIIGDAVVYRGDELELQINIADRNQASASIPGAELFGGFSQALFDAAGLDPDIDLNTPLDLLNNGSGVRLSQIDVSDNGAAASFVRVDLSSAKTVRDVIDLINAGTASHGVSAAINAAANGLDLTGVAGDVFVREVDGGLNASDLGISAPTGAGAATLNGSDLDPTIREETPISLLRGGLGLDLSGFVLTNATQNQTFAATITMSATMTVGELMTQINDSGTHTVAELTADGQAIQLRSILSGGRLTVAENGGTTASELGFLTSFTDVLLNELNGGDGVDTVPSADFRIYLLDGTALDIDIGSAQSIQDVLDAINNDPANAGLVTAAVGPSGTQIELTDLTAALAGSATAAGTTTSFVDAAFIGTQPDDYYNGMTVTFTGGPNAGQSRLVTDYDSATGTFTLEAGNPLPAPIGAGDPYTLARPFEVINLNGSFTADDLGIRNPAAGGVITGNNLNPVGDQPEGMLTMLIRLREALLANDEAALTRVQRLVDIADTQTLNGRAQLGGRVIRMEMALNRHRVEKTDFEGLASRERDADLAEVATQLQMQQTILQASLAAASRILSTSLINFI
jgi:flagellin-like hook-associated protein FlgL